MQHIKVFLNNTNLQYAIGSHLANTEEIGSIRELAFIQSTRNAELDVHHSKHGDYQIKEFTYEIGGKNKTRAQVKNIKNAFIVKDDTTAAGNNAIPLLYFGFLY